MKHFLTPLRIAGLATLFVVPLILYAQNAPQQQQVQKEKQVQNAPQVQQGQVEQNTQNAQQRAAPAVVADPQPFKDGKIKGWKIMIPGNRPLATPAVLDGKVYIGGGFG